MNNIIVEVATRNLPGHLVYHAPKENRGQDFRHVGGSSSFHKGNVERANYKRKDGPHNQ